MNRKRNIYKLIILAVIVLLAMAAYMTIGVKFHNERLTRFAFKNKISQAYCNGNNCIYDRWGIDSVSVSYK